MEILIFLLVVVVLGFIAVWIIGVIYGAIMINKNREQLNEISICYLGDDNYAPVINFQTMKAWWRDLDKNTNWAYVCRKDDGVWQSKLTSETKDQQLKDLIKYKKDYGHLPIASDVDEKIEKIKSNEWANFNDDYNAKVENQYQQFQALVQLLTKK